ncbi:hypothetical protein GPECTOR_42g854 [Gonium pectorale]|uniref:DUF1764 domain-containing protein n=1 Tax=Gonium pectorale TaxID=33097 RepID=A0A150GA45_GONPE|nr:hypothetical protein GPECTOR_42g854 [Gonium pectorale]|eukprot:KXZ46643.1 hypothetical protein GPECTOR_42g854 [Gonium pectorale]
MGKQQAAGTSPAKASTAKARKPVKEEEKETAAAAPQAKVIAKPANDGAEKAQKTKKSEIDDIFSAGKEKVQKNAEKRAAEDAAKAEPAKKPRVEGSKDDIFGADAGKGRKRTEEGFAIYTEDELGLGKKGGDTDLCPFDCDCCF